jgi:hypothetical protein
MPQVRYEWGAETSSISGSLKTALVLLTHVIPFDDDLVFQLHMKFAAEIVRGLSREWKISALTLHRWALKRGVQNASNAAALRVDRWLKSADCFRMN